MRSALQHLELFARRTVQGWMAGSHRSRRLGVSTEFDHHKNYQPGDPTKHIDWKVSAKHEHFFVKRYIEDTALAVRLVVDASASMCQAHEGHSKYLQAARAAACLAYVIINHGDSAGMAVTSADQTFWLPCGSTERHLVRLLTALVTHGPAATDHLAPCLRTLVDRVERRGLVVLVSDMMYDPAPVQRELSRLQAQGHEILLFQVRDQMEEDFPFNRWVEFRDLENPAVRHRLDALILKRLYREEYAALLEDWQRWCRKHDVHWCSFRSDERIDTVLSKYMVLRRELGRG